MRYQIGDRYVAVDRQAVERLAAREQRILASDAWHRIDQIRVQLVGGERRDVYALTQSHRDGYLYDIYDSLRDIARANPRLGLVEEIS